MNETPDSGKPITRRDLPAVVRRAAELAAFADDRDEQLSEQEVIRIAAELGLAPRHVRQALYEGVQDEPQPTFLDKQFGTPRITASRAVPHDAEAARRALENYLITSEYMAVVRRQPTSVMFEPAPDAVSKFARAFKRGSKHQLAASSVLEMSVRSLEPGWSHVRLRAVFKDDRKSQLIGALIGGTVLGAPLAGLTAVVIAGVMQSVTTPAASIAVGSLFGIGAFVAVMTGLLASARKRYRHWRERTVMQAEGVLDRLEGGDELRPPPPPWMRKLQMKFGEL